MVGCNDSLPELHPRDNIIDPESVVPNLPPALAEASNNDNNKVKLTWQFRDNVGTFVSIKTRIGGNPENYTTTNSYSSASANAFVYYYSTLDRYLSLQTGASIYSPEYKVSYDRTEIDAKVNTLSTAQTDYGLIKQDGTFLHYPSQSTVSIPNYSANLSYTISKDKTKMARLSLNNGTIEVQFSENGSAFGNGVALFQPTSNECFYNYSDLHRTYLNFNADGSLIGISCPTGSTTGRFFIVNTQTKTLLTNGKNIYGESVYGKIRFSDDNQFAFIFGDRSITSFNLSNQTQGFNQTISNIYSYGMSLNGKFLIGCNTGGCTKFALQSPTVGYESVKSITPSAFVLPGTVRLTHFISNDGNYSISGFRGSDGSASYDFAAGYNWNTNLSIQNFAVPMNSTDGGRGTLLYLDETQLYLYANEYPNTSSARAVRFPLQGTWRYIPNS